MSIYNPKLSYLKAQIESLLSQDVVGLNFDIIIRDDGSSNHESLSYLKDLARKHKNIILLFENNVGVFYSFWSLINEAFQRGYDYVSLSDQDDIALPNKLSLAINHLKKEDQTTPLLFFSQMTYVNDNLEQQGEPFIDEKILCFKNALFESSINGNLMVLNKRACELIVMKKPEAFYMHDWYIYMCLATFGKIIYSPISTLLYRQHENNVIGGGNSFFEVMKRRVKRFNNFSENTYPVYKQGKEFKKLWSEDMCEEDLQVLNNLLSSKESFFKRIRYALSRHNFVRRSFIDSILVRLLILTNKY